MYLSRSEDRLHGYGGLPAAAGAVGKGIEAYQAVRDFFSTGGFKAQMDIAQWAPHPRPPGVQPAKCVRWFRIATYVSPFGMPASVREHSFVFKLEYEYDGRNLLHVQILPKEKGSSTLYKSIFDISFASEHNLEQDPVAQIRYNISGMYERWDPISNSRYSIEGKLLVRADGSAELSLTSEDNQVRADPMTNSCQIITPKIEIPKIPVPRHYELIVFFAREGRWDLRDGEADKIANWYWGRDPALKGLPQSTRDKIESGQLKIVVEGYASTTKGTQLNLDISRKRANTVKGVLSIAGDKARDNIVIFPFGEWKAGTPDEVADPKERRARIIVDDIEWI